MELAGVLTYRGIRDESCCPFALFRNDDDAEEAAAEEGDEEGEAAEGHGWASRPAPTRDERALDAVATMGVAGGATGEGRLPVKEAAAAAAERKCMWAAAAATNMLHTSTTENAVRSHCGLTTPRISTSFVVGLTPPPHLINGVSAGH